MEFNTLESSPVHVEPDPMSNINNVRLRHMKSNIPMSQPAHIILSTGDFLLNERDSDAQIRSRYQHQKNQLIFLITTALAYLLHTLRFYISEHLQTSSRFWSSIKPLPITRVYTSHFRPNVTLENFLFRSTEICQTLWLIYILSYIPRRTYLGYLYRNPNIFNSCFCSLLLTAVSLQTISQTPLPPEISCVCLLISLILLIISCRLIIMAFIKYQEKLKNFDLLIIRYFVFNSLFLYTTSIAYSTLCSSIECIAFHFDPDVQSISIPTTIGFSIILILLFIYYFLDQFVYENEFRSIWTPYLFLAVVFHCPPLRTFIPDNWNFYFLWVLSFTTILFLSIRLGRQILRKHRARKRKSLLILSLEEKSLETENQ